MVLAVVPVGIPGHNADSGLLNGSVDMKRVVVVSDFHCGHEVGLTPPGSNRFADHSSEYRTYMWDRYVETIEELKPIDVLIANGDLIDGRGERAGSTELIVVDRMAQAEMAADCIRVTNAGSVYVLRGTDYHVGYEESWENLVAERTGAARIGDIISLDVNGLMFNFRHHIGGSQTPIGRATPLTREAAWNALWNARQGFPLADVIVRSHVHYHTYAGGPGWLAMTTPGLQGYGTRYGERRMSGLIDFGLVWFDVESKERFAWRAKTFPFPIPKPSVA